MTDKNTPGGKPGVFVSYIMNCEWYYGLGLGQYKAF